MLSSQDVCGKIKLLIILGSEFSTHDVAQTPHPLQAALDLTAALHPYKHSNAKQTPLLKGQSFKNNKDMKNHC